MKENGFTQKRQEENDTLQKLFRIQTTQLTIALFANTPTQAKSLSHSLEQAAGGIGRHVDADKTEYMCYNKKGDISSLNGGSLKLLDKFNYLGSRISSNENDINMGLAKAWIAIDMLSIIWKSDLSDKIKCYFFQAAVASILQYGCTTWTLTKLLEKKLDWNCVRMLRAILNKSWKQHPTKQQLYGYLVPISKQIKIRRTKHVGHCWGSKDELISDVLQWSLSHGRSSVDLPKRTYLQQLCMDTGDCWKRWMIETNGARESGKSFLAMWHDIYIYIPGFCYFNQNVTFCYHQNGYYYVLFIVQLFCMLESFVINNT